MLDIIEFLPMYMPVPCFGPTYTHVRSIEIVVVFVSLFVQIYAVRVHRKLVAPFDISLAHRDIIGTYERRIGRDQSFGRCLVLFLFSFFVRLLFFLAPTQFEYRVSNVKYKVFRSTVVEKRGNYFINKKK